MDKKTIQKRRMMSYFIEATRQIIEKNGIETVNIREVADLAGYNSATLYNYFNDIDDLIFFTSLGYLKDYIQDLNHYLKGSKTALERYFSIWRCFCHHSFAHPRIFHAIFFEKYSNTLNHDIKEYYTIFPEELENQDEDLRRMLVGNNIIERNLTILQACVKEGSLKEENLPAVNEMAILVYQGMLSRILSKQADYSIEEATDKTLVYMMQILKAYGLTGVDC